MRGGEPLPRIALTPGEPAGIGPDLCAMLAQRSHQAQLVVIADPRVLCERAGTLGLPLDLLPYLPEAPHRAQRPGSLDLIAVPAASAVHPGQLSPDNAAYVLRTLEIACDGCLSGELDALVTGPVHKGVINEAGFPFRGHTELLAERCGASPVMLLVAPGLRVALATTHLPLAEVSRNIRRPQLERVIRTLHGELRTRFGIAHPRILVAGLNPHAGEGGHLGREEIEVITPVLGKLRADGMALLGPLPADTLFTPHTLAGADAVLAMYHDQGLPVIKHLGFGRTVNVTLGLPFLRTSVDHGTALELAGTGRAELGSLEAALTLAIELYHLRHQELPLQTPRSSRLTPQDPSEQESADVSRC